MSDPRAATPNTPASWTGSHERPHILIVTADLGLRHFLEEGLILGGFWVSVIAHELQALEVFRLRGFDLMLVDAGVPGLGAVELVRRLRYRAVDVDDEPARTDIPILAIAARPDELDDATWRNAGGDKVIHAPIELETLVPFIHQVFADWRADHPHRPLADAAALARGGLNQGREG